MFYVISLWHRNSNTNKMTKLEALHRQIVKEQRRIEMLKNTKELDVDFMRSEIKEAQNKIVELQKEFDNEYEYQQS